MPKRAVLGLIEKVTLFGPKKRKTINARIDTGATKSSMDVSLAAELNLGPIVKKKVVKSAYGTMVRPIIMAKIRINGKILEGEFTLAQRAHLTYPVLVGQSVLKEGKFLVDPLK